jgi:hypothetical protein
MPTTPTYSTPVRKTSKGAASEERGSDPLKEDSFIFEDDGEHGSVFFGVDSDDEEALTGGGRGAPAMATPTQQARPPDRMRSRARPFSAPGGASGTCIAADVLVREAYRRRCMEANAV